MTAKVVHLTNCLPSVGGAERLILDLCRHSQVQPVPVITWYDADNSLLANDRSGAIKLISLRPFSLPMLDEARLALSEADVVHIHLFPSMYLAPLLTRPTVYTEHNTWNRRRAYPSIRSLEKWCYSRFSKVVAISQATADSLIDWLGSSPPRLEVIPNGIDLDRFRRVPRQRSGSDETTIGMAARFVSVKDHETLIHAFSMLPKRYRLLLAADGPLRPDMSSLVGRLGVADRVEFVGNVTDMQAYFDKLDLYVHSSNMDGFSLVCVEAMAAGLPTIASDIPGLRDTIGSKEYLFAHADAQCLAGLVRQISEDELRYHSAAEFAVRQSEQFDIRRTAALYQRAYDAVATPDGQI